MGHGTISIISITNNAIISFLADSVLHLLFRHKKDKKINELKADYNEIKSRFISFSSFSSTFILLPQSFVF